MRKITLLVFYLILSLTGYAQDEANCEIRGIVTDETGSPMPGVNIILKGTNTGTSTDSKGQYQIKNLSTGIYEVEVSFIGYKNQVKKITVENNSEIILKFSLIENDHILDDIIISAGRIREKVGEVPVSSKVVSLKKIESYLNTTNNVSKVLSYAIPSISTSSEKSSNRGQRLRGRTIMVLIDGVPQSTPLKNAQMGIRSLNPEILERIEVINGATSIYGGGTGGGIVNYITKLPPKTKGVGGTSKISAAGSLVKLNNSLGYSLNQSLYGHSEKTGFILNVGYGETGTLYDSEGDVLLPTYGLGNNKTYNIFTKIIRELGANARLNVSYSKYSNRQYADHIEVDGKPTFVNGKYVLEKGYGIKGKVDQQKEPGSDYENITANIEVKNILKSNTHFFMSSYFQKGQNWFFYSQSFINGGQSTLKSKKMGIRPLFETSFLLGKSNLRLIYGTDFTIDNTSSPLLDGRIWVPEMKLKGYAPFLEARYKLANIISIKLGGRYDDYSLSVDDFTTIPMSRRLNGIYSKATAVKGGDLTYESLTFNAGIRLISNRAFSPFISFSQGFALPDIGQFLSSSRANMISKIEYKPVLTNNYELGFSSKIDKFKFEAVGHYSTTDKGVAMKFSETSNQFEVFRDPQQIYGFELSFEVRPTGRINLGGSYSYLEGVREIEKGVYNKLPEQNISPSKLTAFVTAKLSDKLDVRTDLMFVGDHNRFEALNNGLYKYGESPVDGYELVSIQANYVIRKNIQLNCVINNVFNKSYFPVISQISAPLKRYIVKGQGTNFTCSLKIDF